MRWQIAHVKPKNLPLLVWPVSTGSPDGMDRTVGLDIPDLQVTPVVRDSAVETVAAEETVITVCLSAPCPISASLVLRACIVNL